MDNNLNLKYEKEYWFISAIINKSYIDCEEKATEIENIIQNKIKDLTDSDLSKIGWNEDWVKETKEMGKNLSINCSWKMIIESFPYTDENLGTKYDALGYFEIEAEYYPDDKAKKSSIKPVLIQQIPIVIKKELEEYRKTIKNKFLNLDLESPIYIFVICNDMTQKVKWTEENIHNYKKVLGRWTEIYSGQWPDYSDELYESRIKGNLSNRISELHFIRRNSGLVYMEPENYEMFFASYMKEYVINPTAQIRAIIFSLMAINESLDILFIMQNFMDPDVLEDKMESLRLLRGVLQTQMSIFYNELDYNRRQHYTKVLTHLIYVFHLNRLQERINDKFDVIQDAMDVVYQRLDEENQSKVQRGMKVLNALFSLGIIIDLVMAIEATFSAVLGGSISMAYLLGITSIGLLAILIGIGIYLFKAQIDTKRNKIRETVDSVLFDKRMENIILIKRKYPPCAGQYAFPGGFIDPKESPRDAVKREVKEETGLDIVIEKKIGVYDEPGRDPRGRIISNAFLCIIDSEISEIKCSDESASVELIPLEKLKDIDLAFDHEDILNDALKMSD
ncbi:MAG: NUDIX domain-containing protein [Candidatus Lokiarchaeota archaeon]|nr:NUDIX domain-containing protein [Candidatus Lokiarchaeota archaeon]